MPAEEIDLENGLSRAEVEKRVRAGQVNDLGNGSSRSLAQIIRGNICTRFNAILGAAFVLILLTGRIPDALFGFVLVINTLIGILGEYRAKRVLDKLAVLAAPNATVIRDGERSQVPLEEVVLDDVLVLQLGDQIAADAVVKKTSGLDVDESLLTGESEPVSKNEGEEVLSGSFVVSGSATTVVTRVGAASFAGRLTDQARQFRLVHSELQDGVNTVLKWVTWFIVPIAILLAWNQMRAHGGFGTALTDGSWREAVASGVAGVVGMVPEGLVLLTSINFALSAMLLARQKVLVQELPAVEVLARVDVVCLDKTGTITDGTFTLDDVSALADSELSEIGFRVLQGIATQEDANATAAAARRQGVNPSEIGAVIPFSSARKWSAAQAEGGVWLFGAPEMLMQGQGAADSVLPEAKRATAGGLRVLLLARSDARDLDKVKEDPGTLTPVLLVKFREKIRPDASETLAYFREQGVDLKVISGDNARTVGAIASRVALVGEGEEVEGYDARGLPNNTDELAEVLEEQHAFGRVTPEQKRAMVHALQSRGHVVAMTGDGVNDALALKDADIGIAMGSGAPATKSVARLVLLDGKFSSMPGVLAQGRRVMANMERSANLFLTKTTYAVLLAILVVVFSVPYPFLPRHLTLISSLTIGIPAFFISLAPNNARYRKGFLRRVLTFSVPAGIAVAAVVMPTYGLLRGAADRGAATAAALVLGIVSLWILSMLARPWNWWRILLVLTMAGGFILAIAIPVARHFFQFVAPTSQMLLVIAVASVVGIALVETVYQVGRLVIRKKEDILLS